MTWQVVSRPEAENDVIEIAAWYDSWSRREICRRGLTVLDELVNPFLHCRRHPRKNIRWRYPKSFPYRVIYEVVEPERTVIVAAVMHAASHDRQWKQRV